MSRPIYLMIILTLCLSACRETSVPKPVGYFRIDLPARDYTPLILQKDKTGDLPFTFEYPSYGNLSYHNQDVSEPGWLNIEFPAYRAKIYLTYKRIKNDFDDLMEQTYKMNIKNHVSKADAIREQVISNQENKVYGILYDLKGNTATSVQFYITDSVKHYLRGSLYFSATPDADSLEPVVGFFRADIVHLIETLKWRD